MTILGVKQGAVNNYNVIREVKPGLSWANQVYSHLVEVKGKKFLKRLTTNSSMTSGDQKFYSYPDFLSKSLGDLI